MEDKDGMCEVVKVYFTTLFIEVDNNVSNQNLNGRRTVTSAQIETLTQEFSFEEFSVAIKKMHPDKASGPDGLKPAIFPKVLVDHGV